MQYAVEGHNKVIWSLVTVLLFSILSVKHFVENCQAVCHLNVRKLLNPWSRVVLEKLIVDQLVKKYTILSGTRMFITVFTKALQRSLS
jgi:hypothetical protein